MYKYIDCWQKTRCYHLSYKACLKKRFDKRCQVSSVGRVMDLVKSIWQSNKLQSPPIHQPFVPGHRTHCSQHRWPQEEYYAKRSLYRYKDKSTITRVSLWYLFVIRHTTMTEYVSINFILTKTNQINIIKILITNEINVKV